MPPKGRVFVHHSQPQTPAVTHPERGSEVQPLLGMKVTFPNWGRQLWLAEAKPVGSVPEQRQDLGDQPLQEPFGAPADEIPTLPRYFLLCVNYFFYGETVTDYFFTLVQREEPLRILSKYHRFISFALYLTGGHHLD